MLRHHRAVALLYHQEWRRHRRTRDENREVAVLQEHACIFMSFALSQGHPQLRRAESLLRDQVREPFRQTGSDIVASARRNNEHATDAHEVSCRYEELGRKGTSLCRGRWLNHQSNRSSLSQKLLRFGVH